MPTTLYALKKEIQAVTVTPLFETVHVLVVFSDHTEITFRGKLKDRVLLFDLIADTTHEVGNIYTSPIDNKFYTEWEKRPEDIPLGLAVTDLGVIFPVTSCPAEEFNIE